MIDFFLKAKDTSPPLLATLVDSDGKPVNLATVIALKFKMARKGVTVVDRDATIVDAAAGTVRLDWQTNDVATPGVYTGEFVLTYAGGAIQRIPNNRSLTIQVTAAAVP